MAKKTVAPAPLAVSAGLWTKDGLAGRGYVKCPNCPRSFKDLEAHLKMETDGTIGKDGKRTDREARVAAMLRYRDNGTDATAMYADREVREAAVEASLTAAPLAEKRLAKRVKRTKSA